MAEILGYAAYLYFAGVLVTLAYGLYGVCTAECWDRRSYTMIGALSWAWPLLLCVVAADWLIDHRRIRKARRGHLSSR